MSEKKKIGITIDSYKEKDYLRELEKIGLKDPKISPFPQVGPNIILITIDGTPEQVEQVKTICTTLEAMFAARKN